MTTPLPDRGQVDQKYTWNAESVFSTPAAWDDELSNILQSLSSIQSYEGRLGESPTILAEALAAIQDLQRRAYRVFVYAGFAYSVDTTNQAAAAMQAKAQGMSGQVAAAVAYLEPELIALGRDTLVAWLKVEPRLSGYDQFLDNLFRKQSHVRSAEVEEILGMLADPFSGPYTTQTMLTNADFRFRAGVDSAGRAVEVTEGSLWRILGQPDRTARQTAWESYMDQHLAFRNTLASNLSTSIRQIVLQTRIRRHDTSLEMTLFENNIPESVFHNLISTFQRNLPTWQRYFEIRRRALQLETLEPYDMWAPLTPNRPRISYEEAVDLIAAGLLPLGKDYVGILRNGCLEERWVDVYPNKGKRTGAFSWGAPGTHPFIMMSYTNDILSLSTLAHELGHSMHSYLTWQHQPLIYSDYSLFVAEVASNFHQATVRAHLLRSTQERDFQIAVIEEAMANFYRYFFIMPTLARFELETHSLAEKGEALTAEVLVHVMADLFEEGYGGKVHVDRERVGITWSYFQHLFTDYYVFQYATGISGAHALSNRVLKGEADAVEDYLGFLKSGSSGYPLQILKRAGVDLNSPQPIEETFSIMEGYVDRLENLLGQAPGANP
jgi:oligoendopeptidase F